MHWATTALASRAVSMRSQLAAARWTVADRPTPSGLLMVDGELGCIPFRGAHVPVDGCAWGPHAGQCLIWILSSRQRLAKEGNNTAAQFVSEELSPLIPLAAFTVPVSAEPVSMASLPTDIPQAIVGAVAASWLLMQQMKATGYEPHELKPR